MNLRMFNAFYYIYAMCSSAFFVIYFVVIIDRMSQVVHMNFNGDAQSYDARSCKHFFEYYMYNMSTIYG